MRLNSIITERLAQTVYLEVFLDELLKILQVNAIETKPVFDNSNRKYYYLNALKTRDSDAEVIIRLDGEQLNNTLKDDGKDYFINSKNNNTDKLYTAKKMIANAISYIDEISILVKDKTNPILKKIIKIAKDKSIPLHLYDDKSALTSNNRIKSLQLDTL